MINLEILRDIGSALLEGGGASYFDLQDEKVKEDTEIVDASLDIPPERIQFKFSEQDVLFKGKMLVTSDDDFQDTSRYLPIPLLSRAKEYQDCVKLFCHNPKDLEAYQLDGREEFQHDFSKFTKGISPQEKSYIPRARRYLEEKVSGSVLWEAIKKYRTNLAMTWCDMHNIAYEKDESI